MARVVTEATGLSVIVEFGRSHLARAGITPEAWLATFSRDGFTPWEINEGDGTIRPLRSAGLDEVPSLNLLLLRYPPERWPNLKIAAIS
jgi:hypothetical protein